MYYVIELYEKSDMTIKDVEDSHFMDIVRDFNQDPGKKAYFNKDLMAIKHGKMLTIYYRDEAKRKQGVDRILNEGFRLAVENLSNKWF